LTTKETAILNHFAECLGMDNADKQILAHEMQAKMEQYFKTRPDISVLFVLENVEYYIENSKQSLLYKILDMLQYAKIKFAFIGTSQKIDIIDNFEKRIKSRFSHRQILFYSEELSTFEECINDTIMKIKENSETTPQGEEFINELHGFITDERFG
jgi:origin recognition complex subunit 4